MKLTTQKYTEQEATWPEAGRYILAHHDETTVVVYQAYKPSIARYVLEHGRFGGLDFSFARMSWIKPNFLWMMYRCGWGLKEGQEMTLGLRVHRAFFDALLERAVPSTFDPSTFATREDWQQAIEKSDIRLQWDPDHAPNGDKLPRKALQLGLRGDTLNEFAKVALVDVIDMTDFVESQRANAEPARYENLHMPVEHVYMPAGAQARINVQLSGGRDTQ